MATPRRELTPDLFEPIERGPQAGERIAGPPTGFWTDSWKRLKKNRGAYLGLVVIVVLIAAAYIGPLLSPYDPYEQDLARRFAGPSPKFWFGTDDFGRDMWSRVWAGTRVSLYIGFLAAAMDLVVGVAYGAISGVFGGG